MLGGKTGLAALRVSLYLTGSLLRPQELPGESQQPLLQLGWQTDVWAVPVQATGGNSQD